MMKHLLIATVAFLIVEGKERKDELSFGESKLDTFEDGGKNLFNAYDESGLNAKHVGKSDLFIVSDEFLKNHKKLEKKKFKRPKKGKFRKQKKEKNMLMKKRRNQKIRNRKRKTEQRLKKHTHPGSKVKRNRKQREYQRISPNHQKSKHHFDLFDHFHHHKHRRQQHHQQLPHQHHKSFIKKLHKSHVENHHQSYSNTLNNQSVKDDYLKDSQIDSYDWAKIAAEKERRCVGIPKNMSLCSNIEYDMMLVPNLLGHDSVQEVCNYSHFCVIEF